MTAAELSFVRLAAHAHDDGYTGPLPAFDKAGGSCYQPLCAPIVDLSEDCSDALLNGGNTRRRFAAVWEADGPA